MTRRTVLVVTADAVLRASVVAALGSHGYNVLTAGTYGEGRKLLVDWQPDVLVTSVRLREHNGLQLAIVSRSSSVLTKTIVIGYADRVLEADAREVGALYLTNPGIDDLLAAVDSAIHRRERKWPRARANIVARAADHSVRLVDVSYGGFRMELAPGTDLPSADAFDLEIGSLRVSALPVWMKQQTGNERVWCGATVAANDESNLAWREFVDDAVGLELGQ
jgi:DNA-binding response OmpR family regulator